MKYKNVENINIVVKLLKENKIKDLVISPGGTNIPLIKAVQDDPFFNCYSVVDERSASYFAIGIYLQKKVPVALICTSAQATRNYIPGLTEAFYKRVPILAITMEKHPRFKYQEYMQAPDQTSLPNDCVKKSFEMPYISDINDMYYSIRVANQAFLELSRDGDGPVQLCIPWLDFPLNDITPNIRSVQRYKCKEINKESLSNKKILILLGEHLPFTDDEKEAINKFCEATDSVVYTNHLSNFNNKFSIDANLLLSTITIDELNVIKPDIIISLGGQTGDYPFYLAFSKNILTGLEHWRVCQDGEVVDTYDKLTRVYQGEMIEFFSNVNSESIDHSFYELWKRMANSKSTDLQVPFSNVSIAQFLHRQMPKNSIIQFSILNSLRVWNLFELDHTIECYSNVGAFGIDGGMSTLVGQSIATDKLAFMIIGDLAFFYDMNCLGIRHIKNNVRILLINNNGGIEFKLHGEDKQEQDKFIAAANYHGNAKGWAESCGFLYLAAYTMDEFKEKASVFIQASDKPILLEAFVLDVDESKAYLSIMDANRNKTVAETIKSGVRESVKGILGEVTLEKLKRTIRG